MPARLSRPVLGVSLMAFFFVVFDGILMYLAPVMMVEAGITESVMGLILGSSSIFGVFFDIFLCRMLKETHYRRLFFLMMILAALYPLAIVGRADVGIFIIGMALWGFYYDLYNLGMLDFVGRTTRHEEHADTFGVIRVFDGLGYLIAPFLASLLILRAGSTQELIITLWSILAIAFLWYATLVWMRIKDVVHATPLVETEERPLNFSRTLIAIGKILSPVLMLTLTINIIDSFFWTAGPLLSEKLMHDVGILGGAFLVAYGIPPLVAGWFVGRISNGYGKKRTAFAALFFGSLMLVSTSFVEFGPWYIAIAFFASLGFATAWPAMNAAYADYISETPEYEKEIATLDDIFTNIGDVLGPVAAGFAAQYLGYELAFTALGVAGCVVAVGLFLVTPRSITVRV